MSSKNIHLVWVTAIAATACSSAPGDQGRAQASISTHTEAFSTAGNMSASFASVIPRLPATPTIDVSTVPANGDLNPYGVAFVPPGFPLDGLLRDDDVMVSNFNNSKNLQGTGTTIVRVDNTGSQSLFFADAAAPGFSTALGVLKRGFVIVGTVPSTDGSGSCTAAADGTPQNVGAGSLLVVDRHGNLVQTLTDSALLDGPWDLTVADGGERALVFVSNVLSGAVTRLDLRLDGDGVRVQEKTQIASGYGHRCDPGAFVVGPTGLALDVARDVLYVASTEDNAIYAIGDASDTHRDRGKGTVVVNDATHLRGPLGLVRSAFGHLIAAQGDAINADPNQPNEIVEFDDDGRFVAEFSVDQTPGSAFGVALDQTFREFRFAAVDDGNNTLHIWRVP